jgi:hypothetical protein
MYYNIWRYFFMDPMQIQEQTYKARQASLERIYQNQKEKGDELVDDDELSAAPVVATKGEETAPIADPKAPVIDTKVPVETAATTAPTDPQAPVAPTTTEATAAPEAPKDPLTPADSVSPGGTGQDGLVECPELFREFVSVLESKGKSDMSFPNLERELKKRGYETRITGGEMIDTGKENTEDLRINATLEVIGKDGKKLVFEDTNGDGGIGITDKGFAEALQKYVPDKTEVLAKGKSDQRQNVALRAQGQKVPEARKKAIEANLKGGPAPDAPEAQAAAPAISAATEEVKPAAAAEAPAAEVRASLKADDPLAAITARVTSGEQQIKSNGDAYKYQVKDCDLSKCPKGKKQCTGCGDCIKAEIRKAQRQADTVAADEEKEKEAVDEAAKATEVQQPVVSNASADRAQAASADNAQVIADSLKQIQAHLDSYGFTEKTAEELLADGQLEDVAFKLGIQLPENLYK